MATFTTYEEIGKKEDISDIISNISPTKTPFQSAVGNEKVTNTLYQWQEDSLRDVTANAKVEGADAVDATIVPTVMRNNVTQILSETVKVSMTADAVSTYGRARESAYQIAKSSAQLKRDLENAFVGTAQTQAAGNNTTPTARQMAGYQAQLDSSTVVHSGASDGTKPLIEADLLTCLETLFNNGADPTTIMVTPANAQVVSDFAKAAGRFRQIPNGGDDRSIVNVVDLYVSPYGQQKVQINRFLKPGNTLVFEADMWSKQTLRPWTRETLAKTGDALRMFIVGEFSLKHKNFKASGAVVETATGF